MEETGLHDDTLVVGVDATASFPSSNDDSIALPHPVTGEPLRIDAPLEASFATVIEKLGWAEAVPERWWRKG